MPATSHHDAAISRAVQDFVRTRTVGLVEYNRSNVLFYLSGLL